MSVQVQWVCTLSADKLTTQGDTYPKIIFELF